MQHILDCVDCGTDYCPCYLAETGDCLICSQLQGKTFCDCLNWKGVCVYQEYVWNRSRMKEGRKSILCQIQNIEQLTESVMLLTIKVNNTLARELDQPGTYVFLRHPKEADFFDTPMSIMTADPVAGTISIAIQVKGVKTKSLINQNKDILVRGPYWNGLLGYKYLKGLKNSKALLVVRGIAQAPAVPVARKLLNQGNQVTVLLDPGRAGLNFAEPLFREMDCQLINLPLLNSGLQVPAKALEFIKEYLEENSIRLVYSGGTAKLHAGISKLIESSGREIYFCCSNEASFCCGEGVCGSCHTRLPDGQRVKTCKTQLNPLEIYAGR